MKYKFLAVLVLMFTVSACHWTNVPLASDIKTGEYLGVVQNEIRDYESKEILFYEIGTEKGIVRKTPTEITIYEP
ncbi:MAG TPA: hypothetical protein VNI84_06670 [Pyrinomonadaceae bacterium]|nr:hypothetical protein [Pyrinomonadaceae bacterium]